MKRTTPPSTGKLLPMFFAMLSVSAFTFGGGFVIAAFMKKKFVDEFHWIEESEMLDMISIAQASPGAIAVNTAIIVGWKLAGFPGLLTAVIATILPPMVIIGVISLFYAAFATNPYVALLLKGMQAGVAAILFDVVSDLAVKVFKMKSSFKTGIIFVAFIAVFFFRFNILFLILISLGIGVLTAITEGRRNT